MKAGTVLAACTAACLAVFVLCVGVLASIAARGVREAGGATGHVALAEPYTETCGTSELHAAGSAWTGPSQIALDNQAQLVLSNQVYMCLYGTFVLLAGEAEFKALDALYPGRMETNDMTFYGP